MNRQRAPDKTSGERKRYLIIGNIYTVAKSVRIVKTMREKTNAPS